MEIFLKVACCLLDRMCFVSSLINIRFIKKKMYMAVLKKKLKRYYNTMVCLDKFVV